MSMLQKIPMVVIKLVFTLLCLVPFGTLTWQLVNGDLGAQPAEEMNHALGLWALRLLILNLSWGSVIALGRVPNALRRLTPLRRHLGVVTFAYALGHFGFYFVKEGDLGLALEQLFTKTYLIIGLLAFVILLALTVTSADWAVRRLRQNWKRLHRLAYPAVLLTVIHFQLIEKKDWTDTLPFLVPMLALYAWRLINAARPRAGVPRRPGR